MTSKEIITEEAKRLHWQELSLDDCKKHLGWLTSFNPKYDRVIWKKHNKVFIMIFKKNGDCQYGWLENESGRTIAFADTRTKALNALQGPNEYTG